MITVLLEHMSRAAALRTIGRIPGLSRLARLAARCYREGSVTRIKSGHGAGLLWNRSHRFVNGYWLGQYELDIQNVIAEHLKPGDVFWDIGAHAGFFSLIAARIVGPSGRVLSIEPHPLNATSVEAQRSINDFRHWQIVEAAVFDSCGRATFDEGRESSVGRLGGGSLTVETVTLDSLLDRFPAPTFLKMDIEGGESVAFNSAERLLAAKPTMLIELHGTESTVKSIAGYRFEQIGSAHVLGHPHG